ncbi:hypothetical protein Q9295_15340 [Xinfangfangia sp. CPCC 101601]|uniref:L-erythro-3,5-diaminohexanoate dehydrogenase N-terminal domain-containing protein n=1 Tax=Pseudogemmobacter lacusdianii TaxID=3069608 RepID=A0ABU0W2S3_9RHOB|nr:hypothetical protein [Xinfangfangia sp. CPCC 101601]MDQ2067750.1 hypothetical protein [Xinfangfangia sp. CPCC 101601]
MTKGLGCAYGSHRAGGRMPQPAERLDADMQIWDNELLLDVTFLNLDSSSMRQLAEANDQDPQAVGRAIAGIVAARGKMQNPVTGSGGVVVGRVRQIGPAHPRQDLKIGDLICPCVSLSLIPMRLTSVGEVNIATTQVMAQGQAVLFASANIGLLPDDLEQPLAVGVLDVCGAPTTVFRALSPGQKVAILGAGKAGLISAVAARRAIGPQGLLVAFDRSEEALSDMRALGVADHCHAVDLTDPLATLRLAKTASDGALFDYVVSMTNVGGTETAAILCARPRATVFFFGMATSFTASALSAEGAGKDIDMLIGNGYAEGCIDYGFDLVRQEPTLRAILSRRLQA